MAKKPVQAGRPEKRTKKRMVARPSTPGGAENVTAPVTVATAAPVRSAWAPVARASGRGGMIRDDDYRYIYSDLRRIGILAGSILLVLAGLTFVLR